VSDVHLPGARPQPLGGGEQIAGADDRTIDEAGEIVGMNTKNSAASLKP
jgi:hypothetical protein